MSAVEYHRIQDGDPQKDERLAECSCGWKFRHWHRGERRYQIYDHLREMAAKGRLSE